MNKLKLIIIGALIPIVLGGLAVVLIRTSMPPDVWSHENRHMLYESYSPQKKFKIGVYNYDEGALGYTSVQVSIIKADEQYPISGNLLRDQYIESVNWLSEDTAEFPIKTKGKLEAKITVSTK